MYKLSGGISRFALDTTIARQKTKRSGAGEVPAHLVLRGRGDDISGGLVDAVHIGDSHPTDISMGIRQAKIGDVQSMGKNKYKLVKHGKGARWVAVKTARAR